MNFIIKMTVIACIVFLNSCDSDSSDSTDSNSTDLPKTGGVNGVTFYSTSSTTYGYDEEPDNKVTISLPTKGTTQLGVKIEQTYSATSSFVQTSSSSGYVTEFVGVYSSFPLTTTSGISTDLASLATSSNSVSILSNATTDSKDELFVSGLKDATESPTQLHFADINTYEWHSTDFQIFSASFSASSCSYGLDQYGNSLRASNTNALSYSAAVSGVNDVFKQAIVQMKAGSNVVLNKTYNNDPNCNGSLEMVFDNSGNLQYNDQLNLLLAEPHTASIAVFQVPQIDVLIPRGIDNYDQVSGPGLYLPNAMLTGVVYAGEVIEFIPVSVGTDENGNPWLPIDLQIKSVSSNYKYVFLSGSIPANYFLASVLVKNAHIYGWSSNASKASIVLDRNETLEPGELKKNIAHELAHQLGGINFKDDNSLPTSNLMHQGSKLGTHLNSDQWEALQKGTN